jgi:hypothetical protein
LEPVPDYFLPATRRRRSDLREGEVRVDAGPIGGEPTGGLVAESGPAVRRRVAKEAAHATSEILAFSLIGFGAGVLLLFWLEADRLGRGDTTVPSLEGLVLVETLTSGLGALLAGGTPELREIYARLRISPGELKLGSWLALGWGTALELLLWRFFPPTSINWVFSPLGWLLIGAYWAVLRHPESRVVGRARRRVSPQNFSFESLRGRLLNPVLLEWNEPKAWAQREARQSVILAQETLRGIGMRVLPVSIASWGFLLLLLSRIAGQAVSVREAAVLLGGFVGMVGLISSPALCFLLIHRVGRRRLIGAANRVRLRVTHLEREGLFSAGLVPWRTFDAFEFTAWRGIPLLKLSLRGTIGPAVQVIPMAESPLPEAIRPVLLGRGLDEARLPEPDLGSLEA